MKRAYQLQLLFLLLIVASVLVDYFKVERFNFFYLLTLSTKLSLISNCYTFVLLEKNMIFGGFKRFIEQLTYVWIVQPKQTPYRRNLRDWILKAVLTCETCIAGQFSFWITPFLLPNYSILDHFTVVSWSIIITYKFKNFINETKD